MNFKERIPELLYRIVSGETLVFPAIGGTIKVRLKTDGQYSIVSTDSVHRRTRSRTVNHKGIIAYLNLLADLSERFETWRPDSG